MKRARVIPVLLVRGSGLYKSVRFGQEKYVGDPINAIRVFNEKEVDELIILDVLATEERRGPRLDDVRDWASECFMPVCYGGGVTTLDEMERLFQAGVEKVALNAAAAENPELVREAARAFGSQSVIAAVDVRKGWFGGHHVVTHRGRKKLAESPAGYVMRLRDLGAGEILLQSVDRDGTGTGYDLELVRDIVHRVDVPVVAIGGAGEVRHLREALAAGASAVAAGSMFVFHGKHRAVLITYPDAETLASLTLAEGDGPRATD
jgi:cyclase